MKRKPLLTTNNAKTIKGEKTKDNIYGLPYRTYILYMSPFNQNSKGVNLCSHASKGCSESCLFTSGNGGMFSDVKQGRINKSEYFLSNRIEFLNQLRLEIEKYVKKNIGIAIPTFRLNGTTDIAYERFRIFNGKNIFELFPNVQFYDYTKNWTRFNTELPSNYNLTFSRSEVNHDKCMELLAKGVNVAMVFTKVPNKFLGYEVINADKDDLRFLDKKGVICGLKYKNLTGKGADNIKGVLSGFVINTTKEYTDYVNNIKSLVKRIKKNYVEFA